MQALYRLTNAIARAAGSLWAVLASFVVVLVWAAIGPFVGFSDTWQLWCNTLTTILTFNLVFIIQLTQNRDTVALHLKLDSLIKASDASNALLHVEKKSEEELRKLHDEL